MTWRCILLAICLCEAASPPKGWQCQQQSSPDVKPTFGITTRVYEAELPYLAAWLEHYLQLDVDELCLVVTRLGDAMPVRAFVRRFNASGRITLQMQDQAIMKTTHDTSCWRHTWHANLDQDEYIVLPGNFSGLREFVSQRAGANEVRFEWLFVPYAGSAAVIPPYPRTYTLKSKAYAFGGIATDGFFGRGKYFAKMSSLNKAGTHIARCKGPDGKDGTKAQPCCQGPPGYLLHVTRGIADAVLKQRTSANAFEFAKSAGSLRLKYLALLELCLGQEAFTVQMPAKAQAVQIAIDKELEIRLLAKTGLSMEADSVCDHYDGCTSMSGIKSWYSSLKGALFANHEKVFCNLKWFCLKALPGEQVGWLSKYEANDLRAWNQTCMHR